MYPPIMCPQSGRNTIRENKWALITRSPLGGRKAPQVAQWWKTDWELQQHSGQLFYHLPSSEDGLIKCSLSFAWRANIVIFLFYRHRESFMETIFCFFHNEFLIDRMTRLSGYDWSPVYDLSEILEMNTICRYETRFLYHSLYRTPGYLSLSQR